MDDVKNVLSVNDPCCNLYLKLKNREKKLKSSILTWYQAFLIVRTSSWSYSIGKYRKGNIRRWKQGYEKTVICDVHR